MLAFEKDLPEMLRQALAGAFWFHAVRNRAVDRERPIYR
jgi:hypothetical protein